MGGGKAAGALPCLAAAFLAACGSGDGKAHQAAAAPRAVAPPSSAANPLIGVWSRVGQAPCARDQIEFTATRMTAEASPAAPMTTVAVSYDLSDPHAPVARPAGSEPIRFRVIDPDHLGDDTGCVLARAD